MNENDSQQSGDLEDEELNDLLDTGLFAAHQASLSRSVIERLGGPTSGRSFIQLRSAGVEDVGEFLPHTFPGLHGRYQVRSAIGEGGVGKVYLAHDTELGRTVALKFLREEHVENTSIVNRFVEEAQIGGQLNHPSILPVHDLGLWGSKIPFFSMKLVSGENLAQLLARRESTRDDHRRFLSIFEQVCQAVAYAHSRGVIHRDLKPANVMVGHFGEVQVMDWGMAKVMDRDVEEETPVGRDAPIATTRSGSDSAASVAGSVMGTPSYLAPEQARGQVDEIDERTDVFGLGAMLCEILTGLPPHVGVGGDDDDEVVRNAARDGDLIDAHSRLEDCGADAELVELTKRCLHTAKRERPRDASVVADSLSAYLAGVEERAREAHVAAALADEKAHSARRAQRLTLIIAGSVLLTLLFAGGFFWIQNEQEKLHENLSSRTRVLTADIRRLVDEAKAASVNNLAGWTKARDRMAGVRTLMGSFDADSQLRERVQALEHELTTGFEAANSAAERSARDAVMLRNLEKAEIPIRKPDAAWSIRHYEKAFEAYEIDLWQSPVESVAAAIRSTAITERVAVALDYWATVEQSLNGDKSERAERLRRIARESDRDPERLRLRRLLFEGDADLAALKKIAKAAQPKEMSIPGVVLVARELAARGASIEATRLLESFWLWHPSSYVLAIELARAHMSSSPQNVDAARRALNAAVASNPRSTQAAYALGTAYVLLDRRADRAACVEANRRAVDLDPDYAPGHVHLATALFKSGELDSAIERFHAAIKLDGSNKHAHYNLGLALAESSDMKGAAKSFQRATEIDPLWAIAHCNRGHMHLRQNMFAEALASFTRGHELGSKLPAWKWPYASGLWVAGTHFQLGLRQDDPKAAMAHYRKAIEFHPPTRRHT